MILGMHSSLLYITDKSYKRLLEGNQCFLNVWKFVLKMSMTTEYAKKHFNDTIGKSLPMVSPAREKKLVPKLVELPVGSSLFLVMTLLLVHRSSVLCQADRCTSILIPGKSATNMLDSGTLPRTMVLLESQDPHFFSFIIQSQPPAIKKKLYTHTAHTPSVCRRH